MRPKIQLLILLMYSMTLSRKGPITVVWALILELSKSFKLSPEWPFSYTHNSCGYANEDSQTSTLRTLYTACHVNLQSSSVKLSIGLTKCIISSNNLIVPWVTILVRLSFWNRLGKPMERSVLRQIFLSELCYLQGLQSTDAHSFPWEQSATHVHDLGLFAVCNPLCWDQRLKRNGGYFPQCNNTCRRQIGKKILNFNTFRETGNCKFNKLLANRFGEGRRNPAGHVLC